MRKTIIYGILLAGALLIPNKAIELGKMKPVEVICLRTENNNIIIETDTEDSGEGTTVAEAMQQLRDTTAGTICLDTAEYLLIGNNAEMIIPEIKGYIKKDTRLCAMEATVDIKEAAEYLGTHKPSVKLGQWAVGMELQVIKEENGRLYLL